MSFSFTRGATALALLAVCATAGGVLWQRAEVVALQDEQTQLAALPDSTSPARSTDRANEVVPHYFADYEQRHQLPVIRPVVVRQVHDRDNVLVVNAGETEWHTNTLVNATGTWSRPFRKSDSAGSSTKGGFRRNRYASVWKRRE